jgi:hypothetical protein
MAASNTNLLSCCCPNDYQFEPLYGAVPTGLAPQNIYTNANTNLWQDMFGPPDANGGENWWQNTQDQWMNPFDTDQQNSRNCINYRNKCVRKDRISLALPGDCCEDVCTSVLDTMRLTDNPGAPQVEHRTVIAMGPTKMCAGSVSPPVGLQDVWDTQITLADPTLDDGDFGDYIRYQVSKNGHSWTTLPRGLSPSSAKATLYSNIFDQDPGLCAQSCLCLGGIIDPADTDGVFPATNAFWGADATTGMVRTPCPPRYCFLRIVAVQPICIERFTVTYANGGGLCSSFPVCPSVLVHEERICRPLPQRAWPGLPAPQLQGWDSDTPGLPVTPSTTDATKNRQLYTRIKQIKKQVPGGASESQHVRNVRALAGPPWNSRSTTDTGSLLFATDNSDGYACPMCTKTFDCACGVGCGPDGGHLPRGADCGWPARCRRRAAEKHQTDDRTLNELVACAVAGCRMASGSLPCTLKQAQTA